MIKIFFLSLFLVSCSSVFYQPVKKHYLDPAQFKLEYKGITFPSKDKTELHGWFFPSRTKTVKGTIVHFHGNAQNISTHFMNLIWLVNEGYNLFVFDYHGYGQSKGEPSQKAVYEDALAALATGKKLHDENGKGLLISYGQSLGGAISLRALADYKDVDAIDLVVMDSTFPSYQDIGFDKLTDHWFLVPFSPLAFVLVSDEYAPDKVFKKIHRPTLVIVGQKDPIVPQKFGKKIYKHIASEQKWLWKLPDGGHIDVFHHAGGKYRVDFIRLLDSLPRR